MVAFIAFHLSQYTTLSLPCQTWSFTRWKRCSGQGFTWGGWSAHFKCEISCATFTTSWWHWILWPAVNPINKSIEVLPYPMTLMLTVLLSGYSLNQSWNSWKTLSLTCCFSPHGLLCFHSTVVQKSFWTPHVFAIVRISQVQFVLVQSSTHMLHMHCSIQHRSGCFFSKMTSPATHTE